MRKFLPGVCRTLFCRVPRLKRNCAFEVNHNMRNLPKIAIQSTRTTPEQLAPFFKHVYCTKSILLSTKFLKAYCSASLTRNVCCFRVCYADDITSRLLKCQHSKRLNVVSTESCSLLLQHRKRERLSWYVTVCAKVSARSDATARILVDERRDILAFFFLTSATRQVLFYY